MVYRFMIELVQIFREYRDRWREYASIINKLSEDYFGQHFYGVYVFGSIVRGDIKPLSDIDIAMVLCKGVDEFSRAKFRGLGRNRIGRVHPFQIHILTKDEWDNWYMRFVGQNYCKI